MTGELEIREALDASARKRFLDLPFRLYRNDPLWVAPLRSEVKKIFAKKTAFFRDFNGKVACICGTHTHVQTADDEVSAQGTAYITDVGMTGPLDSVIGIKTDAILRKFRLGMPARFEVQEEGDAQVNAALIEMDGDSGRATSIERIAKTYSM